MRRLMLLVRIDAGRPAAWLALATATLGAWILSTAGAAAGPATPLAALVVGGLVTVMALGAAAAGRTGPDLLWCVERAAWPLGGWAAGAAVWADPLVLACGVVGIVATTGLVTALLRLDLLPADAASTALVGGGVAGATGWWARTFTPDPRGGGLVAAAVLAGIALVACLGATGGRFTRSSAVRSSARRLLTGAAMVGAVAGMIAWLLPVVDVAGHGLVAALAWFTALAVPAATLGDGVSHTPSWRRLERSAARAPDGWLRLPPGRWRDSVYAVLVNAAILCWPPLVAAFVSGGARPLLAVVGAVAAAAALLVALTWLGEACRGSPDTQQAIVLACSCAAVVGAVAFAAAEKPIPPALPISSGGAWPD